MRFLSADQRVGDPKKYEARLKARNYTVEVLGTAAELRARVTAIMTEHPELVCVVQNPPHKNAPFLPLGVLAHTVAEAMVELSPYRPITCAEDDWTPMVAWFAACDADALAEISVDHAHPTPVAQT